jgi:hypothetical protein
MACSTVAVDSPSSYTAFYSMQRDIIVADFNRLVTLLKAHGFDAVPDSGGVSILTDGKNVGNNIRIWNECTNKVGTPPAKDGLFTDDPGLVWGGIPVRGIFLKIRYGFQYFLHKFHSSFPKMCRGYCQRHYNSIRYDKKHVGRNNVTSGH